MSINKINEDDLNTIASLDEEPTVTGQDLQKLFDEDAKILARAINTNIIPVINENTTNISSLQTDNTSNKSRLEALETSLITTQTFTSDTITVAKSQYYGGSFDVTLEGYTCLGAIAFDITGTYNSNIFMYRNKANGSWAIGNCSGDNVSKVVVSITYLYIKS